MAVPCLARKTPFSRGINSTELPQVCDSPCAKAQWRRKGPFWRCLSSLWWGSPGSVTILVPSPWALQRPSGPRPRIATALPHAQLQPASCVPAPSQPCREAEVTSSLCGGDRGVKHLCYSPGVNSVLGIKNAEWGRGEQVAWGKRGEELAWPPAQAACRVLYCDVQGCPREHLCRLQLPQARPSPEGWQEASRGARGQHATGLSWRPVLPDLVGSGDGVLHQKRSGTSFHPEGLLLSKYFQNNCISLGDIYGLVILFCF